VFTAGLWARRYAFVVIFEALLALTIIFASLALIFASTLLQAVVTGGLVLLCAPVFWLLIRVMARLQVPRDAQRAQLATEADEADLAADGGE